MEDKRHWNTETVLDGSVADTFVPLYCFLQLVCVCCVCDIRFYFKPLLLWCPSRWSWRVKCCAEKGWLLFQGSVLRNTLQPAGKEDTTSTLQLLPNCLWLCPASTLLPNLELSKSVPQTFPAILSFILQVFKIRLWKKGTYNPLV